MIITLFQNDNFTASDVVMVTYSLQAYSLGLIAFMCIKIFAPGFYSRHDTRTPVRIGIIAMVANMGMNIVLVFMLDMAHTGLALATSLAAYLNAGLLFRGLRREGVFEFQPGWVSFLVRLMCANAVMSVFLVLYAGDWLQWLDWGTWQRIAQMAILCFGGMALYLLTLLVLGMRPADFRRQA